MSDEQQTLDPADGEALDAIVRAALERSSTPGANVGVWTPDDGHWVRSFGVGDRGSSAPIRRDDHLRIASITKTFTATAVLQLVDDGRLGLDDRLDRFVPAIPNADRISLQHLLGMRAGIYDFTTDEGFRDAFERDPLMAFGLDDAVAIVRRHEPLFAPGERVHYADVNYLLLGAIVEHATGRPLADVLDARVLGPLGLLGTSCPATPALPEPFARGYREVAPGSGELRDMTEINPLVASAAGGMISTLDDLRAWVSELLGGTLLRPATQAERLRFRTIPDTGDLQAAYGLGVSDIDGLVGHNGAIFGYSSAAFCDRTTGATIVVLGNQASNESGVATELAMLIAGHLRGRLGGNAG